MSGHGNPCQGWGGQGRTSGRRIPLRTNKPATEIKPLKSVTSMLGQANKFLIMWLHQNTSSTISRRHSTVSKALQTLVKTAPNPWKPTLKASWETNQENKTERMNNSKWRNVQQQSLQVICLHMGKMCEGNAEQTSCPVRLWRWNI